MQKLDLNSLTGTRFFAALSVVFYHFANSLPEFSGGHWILRRVVLSGYESVGYFFCLSGFIMAVVHADVDGRKALDVERFAVARFARIYPVYLLALVFALCLPAWRATPLNVTLDFLVAQSLVPGHTISVNPPAWSLSTEAFFYLSFPLLLRWLEKLSIRRLLILVAAVWLVSQAVFATLCSFWVGPYLSPSFDLVFYSPIFNINAFIVGMAGGLVLVRTADRLPRWTGWRADLATTAALAAFGAALLFQEWLSNHTHLNLPFTNGMLAPIHIAVIGALALFSSTWSRLLGCRLLVFLGEASYAVYLFQIPLRIWFGMHVMSWLPLGDEATFYVYLVLLVAVSAGVFYFFERPIRAALRKLRPASSRPSTPAPDQIH